MRKLSDKRQKAHDFLSRYRYYADLIDTASRELRAFEKIRTERIQQFTDKLQRALEESTEKAMQSREEILNVIDKIENEQERQVLLFRYINNFTIRKMAEVMYYSERRIQQILADALDDVSDMIQTAERRKTA